MKIADVRTRYLKLPSTSVSGDNLQDILIVEVQSDSGLIGLGEVHTNPLAAKAIIECSGYHTSSRGLRELLVGENASDISRLWDKMYAFTQSYGRRGLAIHAISGIDIALWDLLGKHLDAPVSQLIASGRRTEVPAYASDLTPSGLEDAADLMRKHVDAGYRGVKIGWGALGGDLEQDVERVRCIREAVGPDIKIMVDLGMPLRLEEAIWLSNQYADLDVYFLEEPLLTDDLEGWRVLVEHSGVPIATGEKETTRFGFLDLMDRGSLRIIQPDVARAGGITECLRIAAHAEQRGVTVIPHCWSSDILVAATLHYISSLKDCPIAELNVMEQPFRTELACNPIRATDGILKIPTEPGLGIELNNDLVSEFEVRL